MAHGPDRDKWISGQTSDLDPRTTPARPDIAYEALKGKIEATRFTRGKVMTISTIQISKHITQSRL